MAKETTGDGTARRIRTLVVEDSPVAMRAVANILETCPLIEIVGMAWSGEEAVSLAQECKPDLVFTDMEMPSMNGLQLAEKLRKTNANLRLVVLSTHDGFVWHKLCTTRGANAFVTKHRLHAELADLIARLFPDVSSFAPAGVEGAVPQGNANQNGID